MTKAIKTLLLSAVIAAFAIGVEPALAASQGAAVSQKSSAAVKKKPAGKPKKTAAKAKNGAAKAKKQVASRKKATKGPVRTSLHRKAVPIVIPEEQILAQQLRTSPSTGNLVLSAACAYMINQDNGRVLLEKNPDTVLPIASLSKLMTAIVVMRSGAPMDELLTVAKEDYNLPSSSFSRLRVGMKLYRADLLHIALTGSDNRAAHLLARSFQGGIPAFVAEMNMTAASLGLTNTHFEEPTGLSAGNRSTAHDMAVIAAEAYKDPTIREYSTTPELVYQTKSGIIKIRSTNRLIREGEWDIGLQKTGFTGPAGHCLVVQTEVGGNNVLMVVLNSTSNRNRISDVKMMRNWYEKEIGERTGAAKISYNLM